MTPGLTKIGAALALGAFAAAGAAFSDDADLSVEGRTPEQCTTVLETEVCTWAEMEGREVRELVAEIPLALIESVPPDAEMVWPPQQLAAVALPDEVRSTVGIEQMVLNWEAHGHPPMTYMAPHFDFHFYNIDPNRLRAIDCSDESKPARLPEGFTLTDIEVPGLGVLVGLCVPEMGMHAMVDRDATETEPFAASMMLGYYGGEAIFFEPMVAQNRLLERSDFTLPIPEIEELPDGVRYPRSFTAEYEPERDRYLFVFSEFTRR